MKLNKLTLRNFKGIRDFTLDTGGESLSIFSDNGMGKTTIADAWFWLLFGKDSLNRSDFEIKTLGEDGQPIHGLEHEVEGVLDIKGKSLVLKKVYSEIWTKTRGSATKEFTGNTTDHYVDGVPVKKGIYEATIAGIVAEDAFKLLTNPRYFNEVLHWQERRELLTKVCGDVSDEDVITSDSKLNRLPDILQGKSLEDHRKIIKARMTKLNEELATIPIRISEVRRGLPIEEPKSVGKRLNVMIPAELAELKEERNKQSQALATLTAGGTMAQKTKELREIESEMLKAQNEFQAQSDNKIQAAKVELREMEDTAGSLDSSVVRNGSQVENNLEAIGRLGANVEQLRKEWREVNAKEFNTKDYCVTCGQLLPKT